MSGQAVNGTLHLVQRPGQPGREEALPFGSLQELLDLCRQHARGGAFVRVEIRGETGGEPHRLVLDFGQFSAWRR